jgi:hypothetical protein
LNQVAGVRVTQLATATDPSWIPEWVAIIEEKKDSGGYADRFYEVLNDGEQLVPISDDRLDRVCADCDGVSPKPLRQAIWEGQSVFDRRDARKLAKILGNVYALVEFEGRRCRLCGEYSTSVTDRRGQPCYECALRIKYGRSV